MAVTNFIPTIWASSLLEAYQASQIVLPTVNRDYEGDARFGNSVKITGFNTPTIVDYAAASRTVTAETLTDTTQTLAIDQQKAFAFLVDDIDKVQVAGSMDPVTSDAGRALAEDAESYVINLLKAGTSVGTAALTTPDLAYGAVVSIRTALVKAKVPAAGRFLLVNPEFAAFMLGAASKLTTVPQAGDGELRNGVLGRLLGFTVIESPLLINGASKPAAIGYHSSAVSYANQIDSVEALRHQTKFSDILRGLHVYGSKVTRAAGVQTYLSL
jgi:hypothetical protein